MQKPLNIKAVADFLSLSTRTIENYLKDKGFPKPDYILDGKKIRYWTQATIDKWFETKRVDNNINELATGR